MTRILFVGQKPETVDFYLAQFGLRRTYLDLVYQFLPTAHPKSRPDPSPKQVAFNFRTSHDLEFET